jgi:curved DNA-binding protein CbpA
MRRLAAGVLQQTGATARWAGRPHHRHHRPPHCWPAAAAAAPPAPCRWNGGGGDDQHWRQPRQQRRLYALLGVDAAATSAEIKAGFLREARRHHPDLCPDEPGAATIFAQVRDSWEVLSDPARRRTYDEATGGAQPEWVYHSSAGNRRTAADGGDDEQGRVPLAALTEQELESRAAYLHDRIRISSAQLATLSADHGDGGGGGASPGGVSAAAGKRRLESVLASLTQQQRELRGRRHQRAAAKVRRRGGNRGRRKLAMRRVDDLAPPAGVPLEVVEEARRAMDANKRLHDTRLGEFIRSTYPQQTDS